MVYVPTNWQDGITPVNAANLNKLEQGLAAAVGIPADVVVPAANLLIRNRFNGADANHGFRLQGDGRLDWGPGGATAPDTTLYRSAAGQLKTDGALRVASDLAVNSQIYGGSYVRANAEAFGAAPGNEVLLGVTPGFVAGPSILFGANNAWDTNLYRSAASVLSTDSQFDVRPAAVSYGVTLRQGAEAWPRIAVRNDAKIEFGPGGSTPLDTNLYRSGAGQLKTDSEFRTGQQIVAAVGTPGQIIIGDDGAGHAALRFGTAVDTNLYRSAAGTLKTDGVLWVAGGPLQVGGSGTQIHLNNATNTITLGGDTSLYRSGVGALKTDGILDVATFYGRNPWAFVAQKPGDTFMRMGLYQDGAAIYFGIGSADVDTNLSRLAPGVLGINGVAITGGMTPPVAVVGGTKTNGQTYTITAPAAGTYIVEFGAGRHNAGAGSSSTLTSNVGGQVTYGDQDGQRGAGTALVTGVALTAGQVVTITAALQGNANSILNCWAKLTRIA